MKPEEGCCCKRKFVTAKYQRSNDILKKAYFHIQFIQDIF